MIPFTWDELSLLTRSAYKLLRQHATPGDRSTTQDVVVFETTLKWFLVRLRRLGGTWQAVSDIVEWHSGVDVSDNESLAELTAVDPAFLVCIGRGGGEVLEHASGIFSLRVADNTVLAVSFRAGPKLGHQTRRFVALTGASREALVAFYRQLSEAGRKRRMTIWGAAGVPRRLRVEEVEEQDVILPPDLKHDLLSWLDRFWTLRHLAAAHNLPARRGLLLVGTPGTGKTTLLRHLLSRYRHADVHLFLPTTNTVGPDSGFENMVRIVQGAGRDVIVILEDIDRLAESGAVTPAGLLNHLDGLLTLDVPALWIATSNDPTTLDRSLLDRPGRFDRTVILPLPGDAERASMHRRCRGAGGVQQVGLGGDFPPAPDHYLTSTCSSLVVSLPRISITLTTTWYVPGSA